MLTWKKNNGGGAGDGSKATNGGKHKEREILK